MDLDWVVHKEIKQEQPAEYFLISSTPEEELSVVFDKYTDDIEFSEIALAKVKQEYIEPTEQVYEWRKDEEEEDNVNEEINGSEYEVSEEDGDSDEDWCYGKIKKKTLMKSTSKFKFSSTSIADGVISIASTEPPYTCNICSISFPLLKSLEAHLIIHKGKNIQCDICKKVFRTKDSIYSHMKLHKEKLYRCPVCLKSFALKKSFMHHQLVHEEKKFKCDICSKLFRQKGHIADHMKVHRERTRKYKCNVCEVAFYEQRTLNRHIRNVHSKLDRKMERKLFRCPNAICDKYYSSELWFKLHTCGRKRPTNAEKKMFSLCNKLFDNKVELNKHNALNHSDKPENFKCHKCNKCFNYRFYSSFVLHVAQRCSKNIMYTCDHCSQVIRSKTKLFDHFVAVHKIPCVGNSKPCPKCGKVFFSKKSLNYHLKRNHQEFKCKYCNKKTRSKSGLTLHQNRCIRGHIPVINVKMELFECHICKNSFVQETDLLEHMTDVHAVQTNGFHIKIELDS
ncbi:Zinc finger protein [Pseudolycoriella hygida]|uniref:Zinc finger protein n=1 Tax=Pseudolycoriella hygida TaxID=35572 RepID=A0A9Q0MR16_9DIPT|nr:Zinc finger protein [Pseudolycoriella hygida]